MRMRRAMATLCAVFTSCAMMHGVMTPDTRYEALCKTWVSDNVSHLIVSWGPPSRSARLPDGTVVYQWDALEGVTIVPEREEHFARAQERGTSAWCTTRFVARADGTIASYTWNGWNYNDGVTFHVGCNTDYQPPPTAIVSR